MAGRFHSVRKAGSAYLHKTFQIRLMINRIALFAVCFMFISSGFSQVTVDLAQFSKGGEANVSVKGSVVQLNWAAGGSARGEMLLDLQNGHPLFQRIALLNNGKTSVIARGLDPAFILTVGKRTLDPASGGWDVFFDRVPTKPYRSYTVEFNKSAASISSTGIQTIVRIGELKAATFSGALEITLYNGSPLFNVAAVLTTHADSTAILYDAGLAGNAGSWKNIAWSDTKNSLQSATPNATDTARPLEVKYRTVIGQGEGGSLALFAAPHQYFYPLDEAFNLKFTWYGNNYQQRVPGFGIGIRQDPLGDRRYVPWFNAPPGTAQRLNYFCLLNAGDPATVLEEVKKFTHSDVYKPLPGYRTMQSHFHNEFISDVVMKGKPVPEEPNFVRVFKTTGVSIVHLAEFHGPGHPKGPDSIRLRELQALFRQCSRLSDKNFLLMPGEEANNFYGGHWLAFFPRPVYWVMSRTGDTPFESANPAYGKVYHVGDKNEMLRLLEAENGLSWTAHARTKASTGFPDAYKNEAFFTSDHFMGAAWKAIPADLSLPTLSKRVLNLMDDMNNWGLKKHVIGEADLFTVEPENEMYAHLNVNYLQLKTLPDFKSGWQPVLDVMQTGKFFTTTGEILLPAFSINGKGAGETAVLTSGGKATVSVQLDWTFPLNFVEVVSGDGTKVYRNRFNLNDTKAFGSKTFSWTIPMQSRTWARLEAWDIAANGAFTQTVWLKNP